MQAGGRASLELDASCRPLGFFAPAVFVAPDGVGSVGKRRSESRRPVGGVTVHGAMPDLHDLPSLDDGMRVVLVDLTDGRAQAIISIHTKG